jgi:hypothetical protein
LHSMPRANTGLLSNNIWWNQNWKAQTFVWMPLAVQQSVLRTAMPTRLERFALDLSE